ncbi:hypothetical protein DJ81_03550 [Halorubrum sp. Hd13]|nr:hypothetical protein DJ81_03550 [Halorubrum sp. Hd13]
MSTAYASYDEAAVSAGPASPSRKAKVVGVGRDDRPPAVGNSANRTPAVGRCDPARSVRDRSGAFAGLSIRGSDR